MKKMSELTKEVIDNQKQRLKTLTFYDLLKLIPEYGKFYVGWTCLAYGVKMYDAGQYFQFVTIDPQATSLFIMVLLGALLSR